jgi:hypothetical protein
VLVEGASPEQLGPILAGNQLVIYELTQETQGLESVFLELTTSLAQQQHQAYAGDPGTPPGWSAPGAPPPPPPTGAPAPAPPPAPAPAPAPAPSATVWPTGEPTP